MKNDNLYLWVTTILFFMLTLLGLSFTLYAKSKQEIIVIMRHGEKTPLGMGQLTCQGLNRSLVLPKVLHDKFGQPDFIFAPIPYSKITDQYGIFYYVRALATIEPTAIAWGMPVSTPYHFVEFEKAAQLFLTPPYHHSTLFVSWEHLNIVFIGKEIMNQMGGNPDEIPFWPQDDFDSLYVFIIDWDSNPPRINFFHDRERLNNQDKNCPPFIDEKEQAELPIKTFIFIPTAEILAGHQDQLHCKGLNRALALPHFLKKQYHSIDDFIIPAHPSSLSDGKKARIESYLSAFMTIEPTLIHYYGSKVATAFESDENFLKSLGQTVAIIWPLSDIANLTQAIYQSYGGNPKDIPNPMPNVDTIYEVKVLTTIDKALPPSFKQIREQLDNQSSICP